MVLRLFVACLVVLAAYGADVRFAFVPFNHVYYITAPDQNGDRLVVGSVDSANVPRFRAFLDATPLPTVKDELFIDNSIELGPNGHIFSSVYVPTAAERNGDYSAFSGPLIDPLSGFPFPANIIPPARLWDVWAFRIKPDASERRTYILPQIAAGDSWSTTLYFSNTSIAQKTITVQFYDADGKPMSLRLNGIGQTTEYTVAINPNSVAVIEAPDLGELNQGSAHVSLPSGVIGYGVFRQDVQGDAGRIPQEAVVPLSVVGSQVAELIWDQTGFSNALAIANPGNADVTVFLSVSRADGTVIGSTNFRLAARGRSVIRFNREAWLAGTMSQKGFARISVGSGSVTALGLRFAGSAFTSIPVSYR